MKLFKVMKKVFSISVAFILAAITLLSTPIYAESLRQEEDYVLINDRVKVYADQNWEDPVTGEYFRWTSPTGNKALAASSAIKTFEFQIRHSITSSTFKMTKSKVSVSTSAYIGAQDGMWMRTGTGTSYTVSVFKPLSVTSKSLNFKIGGTTSGTISGLTANASYKVRIAVNTSLSYYNGIPEYLCGSGSIS